MLRFPVACLAAAATTLLALAGDAGAAVHVERVGDVIEIRGDAGNDGPSVSSFESAVEVQDDAVTAGPGCSVSFNLGSCPVDGARLVRVTLGDGRDRVYARGAGGPSFTVDAGAGDGDDRLNGGFDAVRVSGGVGDDRIVARGGGTDAVRCGTGEDTVFADSADRIARDCERVSRSGPRGDRSR